MCSIVDIDEEPLFSVEWLCKKYGILYKDYLQYINLNL